MTLRVQEGDKAKEEVHKGDKAKEEVHNSVKLVRAQYRDRTKYKEYDSVDTRFKIKVSD